VSAEEKESFKKMLRDSQPLLKKIQELVEEDINKLDIVDDEDFDNPSWALKQAYKVGYKRGLTKLLEYGILGSV
jgi:BMFP domain-containing protein YqiC